MKIVKVSAIPMSALVPDGAERRALAFIALEFFERRDLFLVSRESGIIFP